MRRQTSPFIACDRANFAIDFDDVFVRTTKSKEPHGTSIEGFKLCDVGHLGAPLTEPRRPESYSTDGRGHAGPGPGARSGGVTVGGWHGGAIEVAD
jgi:hypothetical protein